MTTEDKTHERGLKQVSVEQVEAALAGALMKLLGGEYKVSISKIDFSNANHLGDFAQTPIEMCVAKTWAPADFSSMASLAP